MAKKKPVRNPKVINAGKDGIISPKRSSPRRAVVLDVSPPRMNGRSKSQNLSSPLPTRRSSRRNVPDEALNESSRRGSRSSSRRSNNRASSKSTTSQRTRTNQVNVRASHLGAARRSIRQKPPPVLVSAKSSLSKVLASKKVLANAKKVKILVNSKIPVEVPKNKRKIGGKDETESSPAKKSRVTKKGKLTPRPYLTEHLLDPTFQQKLSLPYISPAIQSKLLIRAVLLNDIPLLKKLTHDSKSIVSYCMPRAVQLQRDALSYAIETENFAAMKLLMPESKPKDFASKGHWLIKEESTGKASHRMFGHALRSVTVARGGKEGNVALLKDRNMVFDCGELHYSFGSTELSEALEYGVTYSTLDKMIHMYEDDAEGLYSSLSQCIHVAIRNGHHILAAKLIENSLAKGGFGFNNLHKEALVKSKKVPLTPFKTQSVSKRTIGNFRITPLHCAAINPDPYCLIALLSSSPLFTILDASNWSIAHYAAACNGTSPLEYLISRGIQTNVVNRDGNTPLHIAAKKGNFHIAKVIINHEGNVPALTTGDEDEEEDETPSSRRKKHKKKIPGEAFSLLRLNKAGQAPLHLATAEGHLEVVKVFLTSPLADINKPTPAQFDRLTPLMIAAGKGHLQIVKHLLEADAKIQIRDRRGNTALTHAVINGHADIVSYLLRIGDNAGIKDSSGNSLIHYACAYGWYFNLKLLMEAGLDPNEQNLWKLTPLAIAFMKGHTGIVDILLQQPGVDINAPIDSKGMTLLLQTCDSPPSEDVISRLKYLIEGKKVNCSITDYEENSAIYFVIMSAAKAKKERERRRQMWRVKEDDTTKDETEELEDNCTYEAIKLLVANGANLEEKNCGTGTAIMAAVNIGNFKLVKKLRELGSSVTSEQNSAGDTLLHLLVDLVEENAEVSEFYKDCSEDSNTLAALKTMSRTRNLLGMTPLLLTLNRYQSLTSAESVKRLVEFVLFLVVKLDSDVNAVVNDEMTSDKDADEPTKNSALHLAAGINYCEEILNILLSKKPLIDPINREKRTPLTISILKRNQKATKILLENRANPNFVSIQDGGKNMILLEASQHPNTFSLIPLFIAKGAIAKDIVEEATGNSILHFVAKSPLSTSAVDSIKSLIAAGVPINCTNKQRRTSLHLAVHFRGGETDSSYEVEDALIESGANLALTDNQGRIPLHFAFLSIGMGKKKFKKRGDKANTADFMDPVELVTLLTTAMKEANRIPAIETRNKSGQTPLHVAAIRGATISASHLLAMSPSPKDVLNLRDNDGNTPFALSVLNNREGCALMLFQADSDFTINLNSGYVNPLRDDVTAKSWMWNAVRQEALVLERESNEKCKYSILQEVVSKDWQGILYLMLDKLKIAGAGVTSGIEAALKTRRFKLAAKLVDRVKHVEELMTKKQSLLHTLAQYSTGTESEEELHLQTRILKTLIAKKADVNAIDSYQSIPLIYAATKWNTQLCTQFVELMNVRKIPHLKPDFLKRTPFAALFWEPFDNSKEFPSHLKTWAETILFSGGNGNVLCQYPIQLMPSPGLRYVRGDYRDPNYYLSSVCQHFSPLIMAVIYGNLEAVKWLLSLNGKIDINFRDSMGRTPLIHAARLNDVRMVKLLLHPQTYDFAKDKLPWKDISGPGNKLPPKGRATKVLKKQSSNMDLNAVDVDGWSAIHHLVAPLTASSSLVYTKAEFLLKLLAESGAKLDIRNHGQLKETPLSMAQRLKKFNLVKSFSVLGIGQPELSQLDGFVAYEPLPKVVDSITAIPIESCQKDSKLMLDRLQANLLHDGNDGLLCEPDSLTEYTTENSQILVDVERQVPFDCLLTQVDLAYGEFGLYNFYKMQLIKQIKGPELVVLFTRWGRMGDTGQYQKTPFPSDEEAVAEYRKIFRSKTGNSWETLDSVPFNPQPKKYKLVDLDRSTVTLHPKFAETVKVDFNELQRSTSCLKSELDSDLYDLIGKLVMEHKSRSLNNNENEQISLPFGRVEYSTLQKAEQILDEIDNILVQQNKDKSRSGEVSESVLKLSEQYFTLVPVHGYAFEKITPFFQQGVLRQQQQVIRSFLHKEFAFQIILAAQFNQDRIDPFRYIYSSLGTKLQVLNETTEEAQLILQSIYATSESSARPVVKRIFRVDIPGADDRMNQLQIGNRQFLWHGTATSNLLSILHHGLQIAPLGYTFNGSLFGKGIYFGDMFAKSKKYSNTIEKGQPEYLLLCEVAVGETQTAETSLAYTCPSKRINSLLSDKDSLKTDYSRTIPEPNSEVYWKGRVMHLGKGVDNVLDEEQSGENYFRLNYNEYIIFKPEQAVIRYLIQFEGNFPEIQLNSLF